MKQDLETVLYKTPVPPCIQGLVCHVPCIGWSVAVDPLSATAAPIHLTQFAVPFVQIVTTACKAHDSTRLCNAWYMVLGPWVHLINCSLNQSERLPNPPLTEGSWFTQYPIRTLGWCHMLSRNRTPRACRETSSSEPPVLSKARFASCTGQIHDTACSTAHVKLARSRKYLVMLLSHEVWLSYCADHSWIWHQDERFGIDPKQELEYIYVSQTDVQNEQRWVQ